MGNIILRLFLFLTATELGILLLASVLYLIVDKIYKDENDGR